MRVLTGDRSKNLIQNTEVTMLGSKVIFERVQGEIRKIIDLLNDELGDESKYGQETSDELKAQIKAIEDSVKNNQ